MSDTLFARDDTLPMVPADRPLLRGLSNWYSPQAATHRTWQVQAWQTDHRPANWNESVLMGLSSSNPPEHERLPRPCRLCRRIGGFRQNFGPSSTTQTGPKMCP